MKKNSKEITIAVIIGLCALMLITNASSSNDGVTAPQTSIKTKLKEEAPNLTVSYPNVAIKVVRHKLDSLLQYVNKNQDFHGSILVAKGENILYQNAIGYADFQNKTPLNDASVFQLASVSKQFTAAAIMLLHQRNQLKLTDSVKAYFPNFPYKGVTIENLLNHTSGLPKYFWLAEHKWKQNKAPTNSEMMALFETSNVQRFYKPGYKFDYSNTNYMVLASIVEKISGTSFGAFLKSNIFVPLQMTHSYVYSYQNDSIRENQLDGYRWYKGRKHHKIPSTINDAVVGDKNVYTTIGDLFQWTLALNSEKLLTKASLDLMYKKGETVKGREVPYGFGFRIDTDNQNSIYHHGKWNGFRTALTKYVEEDLVVIILEHTSYNDIKWLNENIKTIITEHSGVSLSTEHKQDALGNVIF